MFSRPFNLIKYFNLHLLNKIVKPCPFVQNRESSIFLYTGLRVDERIIYSQSTRTRLTQFKLKRSDWRAIWFPKQPGGKRLDIRRCRNNSLGILNELSPNLGPKQAGRRIVCPAIISSSRPILPPSVVYASQSFLFPVTAPRNCANICKRKLALPSMISTNS